MIPVDSTINETAGTDNINYRRAFVANIREPDREQIQMFLKAINVPGDLRGIALVAPVMQEILRILAASEDPVVVDWAQQWTAPANMLAKTLSAGHIAIPAARSPRLRTMCESNPEYAALVCASSNRSSSTAGMHVLGYLLHALTRDRAQLSLHQIRQIGRAFRYFTANPAGLEILKQISGDSRTPLDLAKEFQRAQQARKNRNITRTNYAEAVIKLLTGKLHRSTLPGRRGQAIGGGSGLHGEAPRTPVVEQATIRGFVDTRNHVHGITILAEEVGPEMMRDGMRSGLSRDELTQATHAASAGSDHQGIILPRDPASRTVRAREVSEHVARHNRQHPWQWSQLTTLELFHVYAEIQSMLDAQDNRQAQQSALLVCTILHLSLSAEEAVLLHWASGKQREERANHIQLVHGPDGWQGAWYRPALTPEQTESLLHADRTLLLGVARFVKVPMPRWLAMHYASLKSVTAGQDGSPVFNIKSAVALEILRQFCKSLGTRYRGTRFTEARLTQYFFQRALQSTEIGNAEASQMFSKASHLTATQLHYAGTPVAGLARKFAKITETIEDEVRDEARARSATHVLELLRPDHPQRVFPAGGLGDAENYVGSQLVPKTSAVQRSIRLLQARIAAERLNPAKGWIRRFHNLLTLYTVLFLSWGSGIRAVCYPLPDPRLLDLKSGRLVISDKDDFLGSQTRLVFVPDSVCAQVDAYLRHLACLPSVLFYASPEHASELASQIRSYSQRPPASTTQRRGRIEDRHTSPFFLIDRSLKPRPLGPKTIYERLHAIYPFPANCHRHYLYTHLMAIGLNEFLLTAFLGHAVHGCEPFTPSSSLPMIGYAEELRARLSMVLDNLGWSVIRGLDESTH